MRRKKLNKSKVRFRSKYIVVSAVALFVVVFVIGLASLNKNSTVDSDSPVSADESSVLEDTGENVQLYIAPTAQEYGEADTAQTKETAQVQNPLEAESFAVTEEEAQIKLQELAELFPDGKYWNQMGDSVSHDYFSVTDIPCQHDELGYDYCNEYEGRTGEFFPEYSYNIQCLAYASLVSDAVFGPDAPIYEIKNFENIRAGDHIRFVYDEHSAIVIDKGDDWVTLTEVNADYQDCLIEWGRVFTLEEFEDYGEDGILLLSRY